MSQLKYNETCTDIDIDVWLQRQFDILKDAVVKELESFEREYKTLLNPYIEEYYIERHGLEQYNKQLNYLSHMIAIKLEEKKDENIWRCVHKMKKCYRKKLIHRDNKTAKKFGNSLNAHYYEKIRVPSLKRSKSTWKRFYELFPDLKGKETYNGYKLKQI